jgi:hypothetical protein
VLFLGQPYSLDEPETWTGLLHEVLSTPRVDYAIALHGQALEALFDPTLPPVQSQALQVEYRHWRLWTGTLWLAKADPYVRAQPLQAGGGGDHLLWTRPFYRKHPTLNFYDSHNMLVVRLHWLVRRPGELLPLDRNPQKIPNLCPDQGELRACVNSLHYFLPEPTTPAPNPRTRRGMPDGRTTKNNKWYEDPKDGLIRCQQCNEALAPGVQARFQQYGTGGLRDHLHCPHCYHVRMEQSGGLGRQVRGISRRNELTPREMEEEREFFKMARLRNEVIEPDQPALPKPDPNAELNRLRAEDPDWWKQFPI